MWPTDEFAEANSKMGCNIKQQTQRQRSSAKFALTITLMTSFILFGLISCVLERVQCVTQQQQTSGGELTNDNSQVIIVSHSQVIVCIMAISSSDQTNTKTR